MNLVSLTILRELKFQAGGVCGTMRHERGAQVLFSTKHSWRNAQTPKEVVKTPQSKLCAGSEQK